MSEEQDADLAAGDHLAAFQWILGRTLMGSGMAALADGAGAVPPTVYGTETLDMDAIDDDGRAPPALPGLPLVLSVAGAGGAGTPAVTLGEVPLEAGDFSFDVTGDVLNLELTLPPERCDRLAALYRAGRIKFSPSGQSFTGYVTATCASRGLMLRWVGNARR